MPQSKNVSFQFKLEGKGKIWSVNFYPEKDEDFTLPFTKSADLKTWETEVFEFEVVDPFDFKLVVGARSGTKWDATLKIINGTKETDFIKMKGKTGDSDRNKSIVTKPSTPLPAGI